MASLFLFIHGNARLNIIPQVSWSNMANHESLIHDAGQSRSTVLLAAATFLMVPLAVILKRLLFPTFDAREPPILRPKVPFFGHVVSLVKEAANFNNRLYREHKMPICTLPMLHGKMYLINSPALIAAAMRTSDISFFPIEMEATASILDMPPHHLEKLGPEVIHHFGKTMATALMKQPLHAINSASLGYCSEVMNAIGADPKKLPAWDWIQEVMAMAASRALYGRHNMWDMEKFGDLWTFDDNLAILGANIAPKLLAPRAVAARQRMNALLRPFYVSHLDDSPDVASIVKERAKCLRDVGIPSEDLSSMEFLLPWAATTNTIPMTFWFLMNIFAEPEYVDQVRQEILEITEIVKREDGRRDATVNTRDLESRCPFLMACYRELLRLYVAQVFNRRAMQDVTLEDSDGRQYLLKKGINMQWATSVIHLMPDIWGDDVTSFKPERFLNVTPEEERRRRGFMLPFGGGKHMCPGRFFAQTEIVGFVGALALGFNIEDVKVPPAGAPTLAGAARHPERGRRNDEIVISRRIGWEDVNWNFAC
ncbi:7-alpha-hydroxycholest-4-en-3-one 12-alpha-hydroxylase [Colletotrichum siamense]|uniref:7-alpha-hydroxycholest-4-en-3-one 12-alpha-hydroxylase n=1 Tax=Colletotrichum siamense TaxID=690259 RepID=A0A9P5EW73_COLSI|nr:7-alpha-hydroxycholest-4-en-3-one 12-alpha-hydroxylase [Colletotrichum siamense]KAF4860852.1 7-alpha-hydroxycholest-4-en-3-one 12-alpha-hydroxylase [Colletotrichum siamense]